jgi:DNA-binding FadR family transcriptional regulator
MALSGFARPAVCRDDTSNKIDRNQFSNNDEILVANSNQVRKSTNSSQIDQPILEVGLHDQPQMETRTDPVSLLRSFIESGAYAPGDRLPPERDLIGKLNMTRSTLRKALDVLEREGAVWRHVGKGTFVAEASGNGGSLVSLGQQLTPIKIMRARLCIEPAIAREAAINASAEAIVRMKLARERAQAATNWPDYERQDDLFHRAVAEGSDNLLLTALFDQLNQVRRAVAWNIVVRGTARPPEAHRSFAEHDRILAAIEAHEPTAAFEAMRDHIKSVAARLFEEI